MTAPVGSQSFHSEQSIRLEKDYKKLIQEVVQELNEENNWQGRLKWHPKLNFNQIYQNNDHAIKDSGKPSEIIPDGGFISIDENYIWMGEAKFKKAKGNADERVFCVIFPALTLGIKRKNITIVFGGECVDKNNKGYFKSTATRKVVQTLQSEGITYYCNPSPEDLKKNLKASIFNAAQEVLKNKNS